MVQVRQQPISVDGSVDIPRWLDTLVEQIKGSEEDRQHLKTACDLALQLDKAPWHSLKPASLPTAHDNPDTRWSDKNQNITSSFATGIEMAQILAELHLDANTLLAAILYRSVREGKLALQDVERQFGHSVARLIDGVLRMAAIGNLRKASDTEAHALGQTSTAQIEHLRKMLIALIDDVRVPLIKIAERTCAIRAVKNADEEKRRRVAHEVKDIYAPLAHRLGIGQIRWELEDLAFRYLEPEAYQHIAHLLDEKRLDRQKYIDEMISLLQIELDKAHINAQIKGRAKHIYSIWRKMHEKDIGFSQVYDVRAVRILVNTVHECYIVLGMVHGLWRAIPNEFDDYIANPKDNGYRSLHTAVIGPQGKVMEVQIRTHWMNSEAEFGVCAHWQYKKEEGNVTKADAHKEGTMDYEQKVEWLRQVLEWHEETGGDSHLIEELRSDVIHHKIYVFTPEGDVVELQKGATALDFAYHVHTGIGHRCRGARVNGKVVPLHYSLKSSEQVEIITGKHEVPNREWLSEGLGYVMTARARSKIQQWFRQQDHEQHIVTGSILLDREFKHLALTDIDLEKLAQQLNLVTAEDLYAAVGASDIDMLQVLRAAQQMEGVLPANHQLSFMQIPSFSADLPREKLLQRIIGVGNMRVELPGCCSPSAGSAIGGVITSGMVAGAQVAVIHRQDCEQFLQAQVDEPEKIIRVSWPDKNGGYTGQYNLEVDVELNAYERTGLLRDITELLDKEGGNILKLMSVTDKSSNTVAMTFTVEIASLQKLSVLLSRLNKVPNIYFARRKR